MPGTSLTLRCGPEGPSHLTLTIIADETVIIANCCVISHCLHFANSYKFYKRAGQKRPALLYCSPFDRESVHARVSEIALGSVVPPYTGTAGIAAMAGLAGILLIQQFYSFLIALCVGIDSVAAVNLTADAFFT